MVGLSIPELNKELDELLKKHPHLITLQFELSKNLAKFDTAEDRMYYLSTELFDSFYELKRLLSNFEEKLNEL